MPRLGGTKPLLLISALVGSCLAYGGITPRPPTNARAQVDPGYAVVNVFPHDPEAFTQGLAFRKGALFEGTGLEGSSWLRRVELETGEVKRQHDLADEYFGEGITLIDGRVFQITWQEERAFVYEASTFKRIKTFEYDEHVDTVDEGWGLADNGRRLAMSDGTEVIRFRRPRTFEVTREITVTEGGAPVSSLNELEWIGDEIFANVFTGDDIVRIDPRTGEVTGRLNVSAIHEQEQAGCPGAEVTNGIAYLRSEQRLFVTGKYWCHLYEIELTDPPGR